LLPILNQVIDGSSLINVTILSATFPAEIKPFYNF